METSYRPRSPPPTTPPTPNSPPSFTTLLPVPLFPVFPHGESKDSALFPVFSQCESTGTVLSPVSSQSESIDAAFYQPSISVRRDLCPERVTTSTAISPQSESSNITLVPVCSPNESTGTVLFLVFPKSVSTSTEVSPPIVSTSTELSPPIVSTSTELSPPIVSTSTALSKKSKSTNAAFSSKSEPINTAKSPQSVSTSTAFIPVQKSVSSETFVHQKEEWLSDSDSQNTMICSTTSSSPGPSVGSTSTTGGGQIVAGSSKSKISRSKEAPVGQKPAQVVARRNARERRRVQAVNWAFARLRKVVPLEDNKSKRMSKVKTLQMAIEYINQLQGVLSLQFPQDIQNTPELQQPLEHQPQEQQHQQQLQQHQQQQHHQQQHHQLLTTADINLFSDVQYRFDQSELQFRMPPNFYTQLLTDNQN